MVHFVAHFHSGTITSFPLCRCSCHVDAIVKWHRSGNFVFPQIHTRAEPGDHTCDHNERLRSSANECDHSHVPSIHFAVVLVACAPHNVNALPHGRIPGTLGTGPGISQNN
jgi:hypothetical protein